jgi:hypothetical protein
MCIRVVRLSTDDHCARLRVLRLCTCHRVPSLTPSTGCGCSFGQILCPPPEKVFTAVDVQIETAYDVLLMSSMRQRLSGDMQVNENIKYADVPSRQTIRQVCASGCRPNAADCTARRPCAHWSQACGSGAIGAILCAPHPRHKACRCNKLS